MSNNFIIHYAKGSSAKKHKYISKENGKYVYPENMPKEENVEPEDTAEKSLIEKIIEANNENKARNDKIDDQMKQDYEDLLKKIDDWLSTTWFGKIRDMKVKDLIDLLKHDGMSDEEVDEFLAHYGISGMKWGSQNGPPYPLSRGQLSSAEKKKGGVSKSAKEKYGGDGSKKSTEKKDEVKKAEPKKEEVKKEPPKASITKSEAEQYPTRLASAQNVYENRSLYSNKELQDYINRVNLERQVGELAKREYEAQHPVKTFLKKKGTQIVDRTVDNAINAGQNYVKNFIEEAIGGTKDFSGPSITDISAHPERYTTKQIQEAYSRYNMMNNIKNLNP